MQVIQNEALWDSFDSVVETNFGKYHKSKAVERLIWCYLKGPEAYDLIELPEDEESRNINITVNYDIWSQFLDFIKSKHGKSKMQSQVIHSIIVNLFENKNNEEISSFLRLVFKRFADEVEGPLKNERKDLEKHIIPQTFSRPFNQVEQTDELSKLRQLRNIIVHSLGQIPLDTLYKSMNIESDADFLELVSYLEQSNIRIDWDKRQLIIN